MNLLSFPGLLVTLGSLVVNVFGDTLFESTVDPVKFIFKNVPGIVNNVFSAVTAVVVVVVGVFVGFLVVVGVVVVVGVAIDIFVNVVVFDIVVNVVPLNQ